jgi:glycerophosphoryl diester phosphodiesterase
MNRQLAAFYRRDGRALVLGHRGCRNGSAAENSLGAIETAADAHADGVEIDVRPARDGSLVVAHDPTLARVSHAGDERRVCDLLPTELQRIALRYGGHIPSLRAVLELCRARQLRLNVELKRDVPNRRAAAVAAARNLRFWRATPLVVSSFDPAMLLWFRLLAPTVPIAQLHGGQRRHRAAQRLAVSLARADAVHLEYPRVSARAVARYHARGRALATWTVNDPTDGVRLAGYGVDAIITDRPRELRAALTSAPPR